MDSSEEFVLLEKKYWKAMGEADVETAISLTRFPCVVSSPHGTRFISEDEYRKMMKNHPMDQYKNIKLLNPRVEILSHDTALISYEIETNGKRMSDLSTWIRHDNEWLCAFHSENPIQ